MDAWALLKTWSPLTAIGYEIKVDRSDFLRDRKWEGYLPVCHELYFACPAKLIAPDELPQDVGPLWLTGSRLVTKRKAVRRTPDHKALVGLMAYVLMSRTRVVANMWEANAADGGVAYWRAWLSQKGEDQRVGREVSRQIRRKLDEAISAQRRAENERDRLEEVRDALKRLGLDERLSSWDVERRLGGGELRHRIGEARRLIEHLSRVVGDAERALCAPEPRQAEA